MRHHFVRLALMAAAVTFVACSGTETLQPPSTDLSGGSTHGSDTTVHVDPGNPPPVPSVVASFNLSGVVNGHEPGADTVHVVPVASATITLVKVGEVNGDTLNPSVTTATATSDAQGAFRIENLAPAYYRIDVTAPAGSPFLDGVSGIGPARETEIRVWVSLGRKP
jgi:hypothetical protein